MCSTLHIQTTKWGAVSLEAAYQPLSSAWLQTFYLKKNTYFAWNKSDNWQLESIFRFLKSWTHTRKWIIYPVDIWKKTNENWLNAQKIWNSNEKYGIYILLNSNKYYLTNWLLLIAENQCPSFQSFQTQIINIRAFLTFPVFIN